MMKSLSSNIGRLLPLFMLPMILISTDVMAQRRPAGGAKSRPSPAAHQRPAAKPATSQRPVHKPTTTQRPVNKPTTAQKPATKNSGNNRVSSNAGNRPGNQGGGNKVGNKTNVGNKVNVDNSRKNVNVNIDNSKNIKINNNRNTVVRHNNYRPYTRPPYVYGGYRYRCYHPYFYHPYRPFYWGPVWHPWGFFIATLATTAIIVSFADADIPPGYNYYDNIAFAGSDAEVSEFNMRSGPNLEYFDKLYTEPAKSLADGEYYYDQGVFYLKESEGYTVVAAPVGGIIKTLPSGYETIVLDESSKSTNYYWGGTFYEKVSKGYKVVPPTSGAVVEHICEGGEEVKMGDVTYVKLGETYFQPIQQNGKNMYEVADVEEDK